MKQTGPRGSHWLRLLIFFCFFLLFLLHVSECCCFFMLLFFLCFLLNLLYSRACRGLTLPPINARSCYCKQNSTCNMWAKHNGQSDQWYFRDFQWVMGPYRRPLSQTGRGLWTLVEPRLWTNEYTGREDKRLSPPWAAAACICLMSHLSKISQEGVLERNCVQEGIQICRSFGNYPHAWSRPEDVAALVSKPFLLHRGHSFFE